MEQAKGELLEFKNIRYWRQNAALAIRDIYDAFIEIITNADDRYVCLGENKGRVEIEIERKRKGSSSIVKIRDFADGMTLDTMRKKLKRVGDRISGMEEDIAVRGTNSRGAKDVAILGGVIFESIAGDDKYHKCEITAQGRFILNHSGSKDTNRHRKRLKISNGTGTVVTLIVDPAIAPVPQHDTLRNNLSRLVALRDIFMSPYRTITLYDANQKRSCNVKAPIIEGHECIKEKFKVPGYDDVEAKLVIMRAKTRFEDARPKFRMGGILVKSRHAIHDATLFGPDLENDPHAKWFYGKLTCEYIDELWNEYDNRFEQGLPALAINPRPIIDPLRKEGLSREHPFVDALYKEALKRLRPLVEQERKQAESQKTKIESGETRKRLKALEKAAAKFMSENREGEEIARDADDTITDSIFEKYGYSLSPPFAQIVIGHSLRFWLNIKQDVFPELAVGDTVQISCATDEIRSSKNFGTLEAHPNRKGVLRCVWSIKGVKVTKYTEVKVRVASIVDTRGIEVLESEKDRYSNIKSFCFGRKRYTVRIDTGKTVVLYAPSPSMISNRTAVEITCSDPSFNISGEKILVPRPDLGVAICKLRLTIKSPDRRAIITADIPGHRCESEIVSIEPTGAAIKIEFDSGDWGNQRSFWRTNILYIAAKHPSLYRYLGPPPGYLGQNENHFRVLIAEIVADAVVSRLISRNASDRPHDFEDYDWDAYYAEYSRLLTKFLPIAHSTQVSI